MAETATQLFARAAPNLVPAAFSSIGPVVDLASILDTQAGANPAVTLAAEQINHLQDAYRYLSSAINAFLANSPGNALHFAYYSQLRSALSLFSGHGIRLKQGDNAVLGADGQVSSFKLNVRTTHEMAWELWGEWVKSAQASEILMDGIRLMHGLSLRDFTALPDVSAMLLSAWGYDLFAIAKSDRDARNKASYNVFPETPLKQMHRADVDTILEIWALLLSSGSSVGFDVSLVRFFIDKIVAEKGEDDPQSYRARLMYSAAQQTGVSADRIGDLLDRSPSTNVFTRAADDTSDVANVICRASLLLRVATLGVQRAASSAGSPAMSRWMTNWLSVLGLHDPSLSELRDIEADYANALETSAAVVAPIPNTLWEPGQIASTIRLTRVEAFVAWALVA